ncbi:hypothetical protein VP01_8508g1, partial [Puccinia sorghi]
MYTSPFLLVPSSVSLTDISHSLTGITQKISDLQSSYNTAPDWKQNTDKIHSLCQYWDILDPITRSRSVAKPLFMRC